MTPELERLVGFGRHLRSLGLPVGTSRIISFCRAASLPLAPQDLYWAARATLVSSREQFEVFDRAYVAYFTDEPDAGPVVEAAWKGRSLGRDLVGDDDEDAIGGAASSEELLRTRSIEHLSDEEMDRVSALIRQLSPVIARRSTRRSRPTLRGDRFDLRRTLRRSLRTGGEPFHRSLRTNRTKARPLVLILDVSGSMSAYARAFLQFGLAAVSSTPSVEVFCFGTRLTRVTRALREPDPQKALIKVAADVPDWSGGTRIGEALDHLVRRHGQHRFLRGAVVVLCSDGLERGDPAVLRGAMARLDRLAHRVVWVNPLKASPRYEPVAKGMAAALPYVDTFVSGHNLASLEELGHVLASI